ncbi:MAG: AMIN domain-containing protein [Gemmatimonadaceae bacterium]|nr:AMIN domain-containing protein [Gemmatimonadaceae bacterium]
MRRVYQLAVIAAALTVGARSATAASETPRAPSSVTALSVVPAAGRAEVVVAIDGTVDVVDFTLNSPRRIVIDFRGATLTAPASFYDKVSRGGITNVRVAQFKPDVVRLVLYLDGAREYSVVRGERDVRIAVSGPDQFAAWHLGGGAKSTPATALAADAAPVTAEPRTTDAAPSEQKAQLPLGILREVAPSAPLPIEQPRITVTYERDTEIRDVIGSFATFANKTIVAGAGVANTKIGFMEIKNQPWDVALAAILRSVGLTAIEDSTGIITVDSYTNIAARTSQEPLVSQIVPIYYAKAATLATTITSLLNAGCGKGAAGVPQAPAAGGGAAAAGGEAGAADAGVGGSATAISTAGCGRGSVATDDKTNVLIITETQARLNDVMGFIKDLDVRTPLVAIKAKIIAVDRTGTEKLGISYDLGTANAFQNALMPRIINGAAVPGDFRVDLTGDAFTGIANASRAYSGEAAVSLIYNIAIGGFNLTSFLDALSQEQLTDIQAEPSITTLDNTEATLFSGSTLSFLLTPPVPAGQLTSVAPQIQSKDIGITLKVTPRVTANRQLNLIVEATQEQLVTVTAAGPNTNRRNSKNEVLVADGETAVIGGLTQTQITKNRSGIPILSSLPLIGRLFSETSTIEQKQDLLILITPHILDDGETLKNRPVIEKNP